MVVEHVPAYGWVASSCDISIAPLQRVQNFLMLAQWGQWSQFNGKQFF
jgi:hypothetical protein